MGMYTQIRGWLNVDSIGSYDNKNLNRIEEVVNKAKYDFKNDNTILDVCGDILKRKWVCDDTYVCPGGNGSVFIFIGTEMKNYGSPAEIWIKYLLDRIPNAEGRIDFQYEEDEEDCKCWLINQSDIQETYVPIWCEGYGNMYIS